MTEEEKQRIEKEELERLTRGGFGFEVEYDETKRFLFWKRLRHVKREIHIEEPTLGTLDRMSRLWVKIGGTASMDIGKASAVDLFGAACGAMDACRVVATAAIGSEYARRVRRGGWNERKRIDREIEELAGALSACLRPRDLHKITAYILATANLADFYAAITMMSAGRTTRPTVVAENEA